MAAWSGHIRALLYPVQFEPEPREGIERVLRLVVYAGALGASPDQYLRSIRAALASDVDLAALLPQPHPNDVIHDYLAHLECRLAQEIDARPG
jgi:hypothetical protein